MSTLQIDPILKVVWKLGIPSSVPLTPSYFEYTYQLLVNIVYGCPLDLSHNLLESLPKSIGELYNLTSLIAVKNQLKVLPKSVRNLKCLQSLHLNGNQLSSIPPELCKCEILKDIYLESNRIQRIPEELTQLHFLNHINIAKNNLQELPNLPFISEARINFEDNVCINEIPFLFGCQQNYLRQQLSLRQN